MKTNTLLYNRYRPRRFDEVAGNEQITDLLKALLANGEIANTHFIFSGTPGTGKTTSARILACAINCQDLGKDGEPCNKCEHCTAFLNEVYPDYIEVDGTQYNKVEAAKRLVDLASQYPVIPGGYRVIMIDEAHALSNQAFDKFLLLLESADVKTIFIFSTTDLHLFRAAIVSRCFTFTIKPLNSKGIAKELMRICEAEGVPYNIDAINKLSYHFTGKPRDAIKTLDLHIRATRAFLKYEENTQETYMLAVLKAAYFNRVEEYQTILDNIEPSFVFRTLTRTLKEIFFYPNIQPVLLQSDSIETFKNLVDITSMKQLIRDASIFKPDDTYSLLLFLTQVSEMGLKLRVKSSSRKETLGRRFIEKTSTHPTPSQGKISPTKDGDCTAMGVVDLEEDSEEDNSTPVISDKDLLQESPPEINSSSDTVLVSTSTKGTGYDLLLEYGFVRKGGECSIES